MDPVFRESSDDELPNSYGPKPQPRKLLPGLHQHFDPDVANEIWDYIGIRDIIDQGYMPSLPVLYHQIRNYPYVPPEEVTSLRLTRGGDEENVIETWRYPFTDVQLDTLLAEILAHDIYGRPYSRNVIADIRFYRNPENSSYIPSELRHIITQ